MARRPAIITQADVSRAIRAAKKAGATAVEIKPDGTLIVKLDADQELPSDEVRF